MVFKIDGIAIKRKDLIVNSVLSKEEFNSFILQVRQYLPEYTKRNRQDFVAQRLLEITEHFGLDMSFYFLSRKILSKLWENIKNTTDDVIAGLCTSITALCCYKDSISVSSICSLLNIRMSTIQFQVKERIFERFRLPGFVSLVRSSDLLKDFMEKVGVLEGESVDVEVVEEKVDISGENVISVKLGNTRRIFNPHNDHYLISFVSDNKAIALGYLKVHSSNPPYRRSIKSVRKNMDVWFDLTLGNFYPKKGPPLVDLP